MKREIKFRAWHKVWKRMYDIDCTHYIDAPEYDAPIAWDNPDFGFMQFTGLKDKNGKEIYEGDICRQIKGNIWVVYWNINLAAFRAESPDKADYLELMYILSDYCKVIGNIYENPGLLEVK